MELSTDEFNVLKNISKSISKKVFKKNSPHYEEGWLQGCLGIAVALKYYNSSNGTSFRTYCYSVMQNNIYSYYTKVKKTHLNTISLEYMVEVLFKDPAVVEFNFSRDIDSNIIINVINKFKKELSNTTKGRKFIDIYEMRYENGMKLKEIGEKYNTTRSNIGRICTKLEIDIIDYIKGELHVN